MKCSYKFWRDKRKSHEDEMLVGYGGTDKAMPEDVVQVGEAPRVVGAGQRSSDPGLWSSFKVWHRLHSSSTGTLTKNCESNHIP